MEAIMVEQQSAAEPDDIKALRAVRLIALTLLL